MNRMESGIYFNNTLKPNQFNEGFRVFSKQSSALLFVE